MSRRRSARTAAFEPVAAGTRYRVSVDLRFELPYALLAPLLGGVVRRRIRRYVLEPMRAYAVRDAPSRSTRG